MRDPRLLLRVHAEIHKLNWWLCTMYNIYYALDYIGKAKGNWNLGSKPRALFVFAMRKIYTKILVLSFRNLVHNAWILDNKYDCLRISYKSEIHACMAIITFNGNNLSPVSLYHTAAPFSITLYSMHLLHNSFGSDDLTQNQVYTSLLIVPLFWDLHPVVQYSFLPFFGP